MLISDFRAGETSVSTQGNLDSNIYRLGSRKVENLYCSITGALIVRSGTSIIKSYDSNKDIKVFTWDNNRVIILEDPHTVDAKLRIIDINTKEDSVIALDHNKIGDENTIYEVFNLSTNYFFFKGANVFKITKPQGKGDYVAEELTHNLLVPLTDVMNINIGKYATDVKGISYQQVFKGESTSGIIFDDILVDLEVNFGSGLIPNLGITVTSKGEAEGKTLDDHTFIGNFYDPDKKVYRIGGSVTIHDISSVYPDPPYTMGSLKLYIYYEYEFDEPNFYGRFYHSGYTINGGGTEIQPFTSKLLYKSCIYKRRLYNFYDKLIEWSKPDDYKTIDASITLDESSRVYALSASEEYVLFANALGIFKLFHDSKEINLVKISDLKVIEGGLITYNIDIYAVTQKGVFSISPQTPVASTSRFPVKIELVTGHCAHLFDVKLINVSRLSHGTRLTILLHRIDGVIIRLDIDPISGNGIASRYIMKDIVTYLSNGITDFFYCDTKYGRYVCRFDRMRYNIDNTDITNIDYLVSRTYCFMDMAKTYNTSSKKKCKYQKINGEHYIIITSNPNIGEGFDNTDSNDLQSGDYVKSLVSVGFKDSVAELPVYRINSNKYKIRLSDAEIINLDLFNNQDGIFYGFISILPQTLVDEYARKGKWCVSSHGANRVVSKIVVGDKIDGVYICIGYPYEPSISVHIPKTPFNYVGTGLMKSYGFTHLHVSASVGKEVIDYSSYEFGDRIGVYEIGTPELARENSSTQITTYRLPYGSFGVILSIHYESYYKQNNDQRRGAPE